MWHESTFTYIALIQFSFFTLTIRWGNDWKPGLPPWNFYWLSRCHWQEMTYKAIEWLVWSLFCLQICYRQYIRWLKGTRFMLLDSIYYLLMSQWSQKIMNSEVAPQTIDESFKLNIPFSFICDCWHYYAWKTFNVYCIFRLYSQW